MEDSSPPVHEQIIQEEYHKAVRELIEFTQSSQARELPSSKLREEIIERINTIGYAMNKVFFDVSLQDIRVFELLESIDSLADIMNVYPKLPLETEDYNVIRGLTFSLRNYILGNIIEANIEEKSVLSAIAKTIVQILYSFQELHFIDLTRPPQSVCQDPKEALFQIKSLHSYFQLFLNTITNIPTIKKEELIKWTVHLYPYHKYLLSLIENYPYESMYFEEETPTHDAMIDSFYALLVPGANISMYYNRLFAMLTPKDWDRLWKELHEEYHDMNNNTLFNEIQEIHSRFINVIQENLRLMIKLNQKYLSPEELEKGKNSMGFEILVFMKEYFQLKARASQVLYLFFELESKLKPENIIDDLQQVNYAFDYFRKRLLSTFKGREGLEQSMFFSIYILSLFENLVFAYLFVVLQRNQETITYFQSLLEHVEEFSREKYFSKYPYLYSLVPVLQIYYFLMIKDYESLRENITSLGAFLKQEDSESKYAMFLWHVYLVYAFDIGVIERHEFQQETMVWFNALKKVLPSQECLTQLEELTNAIITGEEEKVERIHDLINVNPFDPFTWILINVSMLKNMKGVNKAFIHFPLIANQFWFT